MTPEQFEQAKREFAEKWWQLYIDDGTFLSDLTVLLEQHKEVMLADMYPKEFVEWYVKDGQYIPNKDTGSVRSTILELYDMWLKNVKK